MLFFPSLSRHRGPLEYLGQLLQDPEEEGPEANEAGVQKMSMYHLLDLPWVGSV